MHHENIRQQLANGAVLDALRVGSRRAVRLHKFLGNPVATSRNGKVVLIPPDKITIDEPAPPRRRRTTTRSR